MKGKQTQRDVSAWVFMVSGESAKEKCEGRSFMRESELVKVSIKGFMSPDHYISYNLSLYSSKRQLNEFFKLSEEMRKTVGEVFISLFFLLGVVLQY